MPGLMPCWKPICGCGADPVLIGAIGDDFTGSGDLANTLARGGMRVMLHVGVPERPVPDADNDANQAHVIALKSRSAPVDEAVAQSLRALNWLQAQGCAQVVFKYCSTFDSTPSGNIGPVAQALAEAMQARKVIVCPAFPATGRTLYQGHLFVHDRLLNESGMERHPLTPMSDADIRRWLAMQTTATIGHVAAQTVAGGAERLRAALEREDALGHRLIVVDALSERDLEEIGRAARGLPLVTGGSGVAMGLPGNFGLGAQADDAHKRWRGEAGRCFVLAGSCAKATLRQIEAHKGPRHAVDVQDVISGKLTPENLARRMLASGKNAPLAYSSAPPEEVARVQARFGREKSAEALEGFFAALARLLVRGGARRLICAGGETSGAVVTGLGLKTLEIGPEIAPGVPAMRASGRLVIALKSGNFGDDDFFAGAGQVLAGKAGRKGGDDG